MKSRRLGIVIAVAGTIALLSAYAVPAGAFTIVQRAGWVLGSEVGDSDPFGGIAFSNEVSDLGLPSAPADTYQLIFWGCQTGNTSNCAPSGATSDVTLPIMSNFPANRSGLLIESLTQTINPGDTVDITHLVHFNTSIDARSFSLTSVRVDAILRITDSAPPFADANATTVFFDEIDNVANVADCSPPSPSGVPCDDLFTFISDFGDIKFWHNGQEYILSFGLRAGDGVFIDEFGRVFTRENSTNELWVTASLRVPAPATLMLLGLGLLGVAAQSLRSRRKQV